MVIFFALFTGMVSRAPITLPGSSSVKVSAFFKRLNFSSSEPISERMRLDGRKQKKARVTELMATDLVEFHDDHRITYPCDAVMREDMRKPQKIRSGNRVSIAAESTKTGHADHFWGIALVVRAATHNRSVPAGASTADLERDVFDNAGGRSRRSFM